MSARMVLTEWDTPEKQIDLLNILRQDGIGIPNNLVLETAIRYAIERRLPTSRLRFFTSESDEDATPLYVFVFEENSKGFCDIYTRPAVRAHDLKLLEESFGELLKIAKDRLEKDGQMRLLSDTMTRQMLLDRFSDVIDVSADAASAAVFYMTDEQMRAVKEIETPPIDGFCIDSFNLEKDSRKVHAKWSFSVSEEATAACFQHLPSVIVRDSRTGEAVAWEMSSPFGACSNLFTLPAFRNKGLAKCAETLLVKSFVREGLRPFKYVDFVHPHLLESTRENALWTYWEEHEKSVDDSEPCRLKQLDTLGCFPIHYTMIRKKA